MAIRTASYLKRPLRRYYFGASFRPRSDRILCSVKSPRSTGTTRLCEARGLALRLAVTVDLLFERLRAMKEKPTPNELDAEMIVRLEFKEDGTLESVETDAKPQETEAAIRLVPELIYAARSAEKKPKAKGTELREVLAPGSCCPLRERRIPQPWATGVGMVHGIQTQHHTCEPCRPRCSSDSATAVANARGLVPRMPLAFLRHLNCHARVVQRPAGGCDQLPIRRALCVAYPLHCSPPC